MADPAPAAVQPAFLTTAEANTRIIDGLREVRNIGFRFDPASVIVSLSYLAVAAEERRVSNRVLWLPALLELQSIVTVIATLVIIAATVAQSTYLHKANVPMIVVSCLFVLTFVINLAVHVHRKRDQDWFVVRKCRSHLEAFEKEVEANSPAVKDFSRLHGAHWALRNGSWIRVPTNMLAVGDLIGLLPTEAAPCRVKAVSSNLTLERDEAVPVLPKSETVMGAVLDRLTRLHFVVEECPAAVQLLLRVTLSLRDPARISPESPLSKEMKWLTNRMRYGFIMGISISVVANLLRFLLLESANPWYQALLERLANLAIPLCFLALPSVWIVFSLMATAREMALFDSLQESEKVYLDNEVDTDADFGEEGRKNKRRHVSLRRLLRYFVALVLHNNGTLFRHAKLFELLGSVTRVCVIDRDGILTQGEDTPETVVILEDKPQTMALSRDPTKPAGVRFNDLAWKEKAPALTPLGLNCMLNPNCLATDEMQLRPFSGVVSNGALIALPPPVRTYTDCLCALGEEIGVPQTLVSNFKLRKEIHTIAINPERKSEMLHMVSCIYEDVNNGQLQLLSKGEPRLVLEQCYSFWDGRAITEISEEDVRALLDLQTNIALSRDITVTAFCYRPVEPAVAKRLFGELASEDAAPLSAMPVIDVSEPSTPRKARSEHASARSRSKSAQRSVANSPPQGSSLFKMLPLKEKERHLEHVSISTQSQQYAPDAVQKKKEKKEKKEKKIKKPKTSKEDGVNGEKRPKSKKGKKAKKKKEPIVNEESAEISNLPSASPLQPPSPSPVVVSTNPESLEAISRQVSASPRAARDSSSVLASDSLAYAEKNLAFAIPSPSVIPATNAVLLSTLHGEGVHEGTVQALQTDQIFIGGVASRKYPRLEIPAVIEILHSGGVRFTMFSSNSDGADKFFMNKLGLPTDWNCCISLRDPGSGVSHSASASSSPAMQHEFAGYAKLPRGISYVREHILSIDNVPLLVPLFEDCSPASVAEMISILQENGEVVLCVGSALRYENTASFAQADIAFAMEPELAMCSHATKKLDLMTSSHFAEKRSCGAFSADLNSLPAAFVMHRKTNYYHLLEMLQEGRRALHNMRQAVFFVGIMYIIVALLLVTSHCALLPDVLSGYQLLWFLWIIVPTVGITLLATPAAPDLLHVPAAKNIIEENGLKLRFVLRDILVKFALFVPAALVIYAWTFYFVWRSQLPSDLLPFRGIFGIGLRPSFYTAQAYIDAEVLAQNVMLFALVLFQASSSATSLHSSYDLITTWKRVPNFPWVCSLGLSVVLQVVFFTVSVRRRFDLVDQIPWGVYVFAVLWLPVILLGQELAKTRYRKFMEREEKWLREEFNTRLGMWSPKDVAVV